MDEIGTERDIHRRQLRASFREFFKVEDEILFDDVETELDFKRLSRGEALFREGDRSDELFFLLSGRLRAMTGSDENLHVLGDVARGESVGELGLVTGEPRSATVVAVRDSIVARMGRGAFERVLHGRPHVSIALMSTIVDRFRRSERANRTRRRAVTLCILPVTDGVDPDGFAGTLSAELGRFGHTRVVTAAEYEGLDAAARDRQLDDAEAASATLLLVGHQDLSDWTEACLARADEVVLLARGADEPRISVAEASYLEGEDEELAPAQTLVLLHPADAPAPSGTAAWLDRRDVGRHLHVRPDRPGDMRRLARMLAGQGIGLVLSGGGARGFAHLGVMKALAEAGIEPDVIGGTSIGSVMGAWRAMGLVGDGLEAVGRRTFVEAGNPTSDVGYLPLLALVKRARSRRVTASAIREVAGWDIGIEDTWTTFFCVAGSFSNAAEIVLKRGSLAGSLLASHAVPGALPPVMLDGHLLVDGATVNGLPVDVMERFGVRTILAVDVVADRAEPTVPGWLPSTVALLRDRLRPAAARHERSSATPERRLDAAFAPSNARQKAMRAKADICFRPTIEPAKTPGIRRFDELVEIGYADARATLGRTDPRLLAACR